ncbi:hypothetical protein N7450_005406 [Penicillium hetheringtonii]|uniref:Uncharacterized protein n=1 Tax=Penicillium hetheringtonii TaxID=911720 RepID=A0AAD6GX96_9EURO|nr:hypothetical protein N7450_005406 [Penicillium hetheringtonii]
MDIQRQPYHFGIVEAAEDRNENVSLSSHAYWQTQVYPGLIIIPKLQERSPFRYRVSKPVNELLFCMWKIVSNVLLIR